MRSDLGALALLLLVAGPVGAGDTDAQRALEGRIAVLAANADRPPEPATTEFSLYPPLFHDRRVMEVRSCQVRYTVTSLARPDGPPRRIADFDLTFADLERNPDAPSEPYAYRDGTGALVFRIDPARPGRVQTRVTDAASPEAYLRSLADGAMTQGPLLDLSVWMTGLGHEAEIAELAAALLAYRADYCRPSS